MQKFIADVMLGRLARWLRTLGYDTAYDAGLDDAELVRRAQAERRVLLTRDRRLVEQRRPADCLLVISEAPLEQLRQVQRVFGLDRSGLFTRCTRCNAVLVPLPREDARGRVPAAVLRRRGRFARCPRCGRIYWPGSHTERMRRILGD